MVQPITTLLELNAVQETRSERPVSTPALDWLYVLLSLLLTIGVMMDVWSHIEFGPDQSIFNEYHLLFYGSAAALLTLLGGLLVTNIRAGYPLQIALPQGYGMGLLAVLLFGAAGTIDLTGHALFGFESDIEALTSPTHLLLFMAWCLILFTPVRAVRARLAVVDQPRRLVDMLPMLIAFGCMMACIHIPLMLYFPMGSNPYMLQEFRPNNDFDGYVMGISGTLLQTIITVSYVLWLAREFKLPRGAFTIAFGFYGLFLTVLEAWQMPWLMYAGFGILLDIAYSLLRPDATRRIRFVLFAVVAPLAMWTMMYSVLAYIFGGTNAFYYSGYNLFGSIAQATALGAVMGYLLSMPAPRALMTEASHA